MSDFRDIVCGSVDWPESISRQLPEENIYDPINKVIYNPDSKSGKYICSRLKRIREEFARKHGIPYEPEECYEEGGCSGTCKRCEAEKEYLQREYEKIKKGRVDRFV